MLVIERDYSRLQSETFHPDLILDAETCFLLEDVLDLQEKGKLGLHIFLTLDALTAN